MAATTWLHYSLGLPSRCTHQSLYIEQWGNPIWPPLGSTVTTYIHTYSPCTIQALYIDHHQWILIPLWEIVHSVNIDWYITKWWMANILLQYLLALLMKQWILFGKFITSSNKLRYFFNMDLLLFLPRFLALIPFVYIRLPVLPNFLHSFFDFLQL